MSRLPKFFTWVSDDWKEPKDVPAPVVGMIRELWSDGEMVESIAATFDVPVEWVELFVRSDPGETPVH